MISSASRAAIATIVEKICRVDLVADNADRLGMFRRILLFAVCIANSQSDCVAFFSHLEQGLVSRAKHDHRIVQARELQAQTSHDR